MVGKTDVDRYVYKQYNQMKNLLYTEQTRSVQKNGFCKQNLLKKVQTDASTNKLMTNYLYNSDLANERILVNSTSNYKLPALTITQTTTFKAGSQLQQAT